MRVIVAKTAGFCFGIKRAMEQVYEQVDAGMKPIYTFGPVVHNEGVIRDSEEKGVSVLHTEEELSSLREGTVVIHSHGVGKHICELLESKGIHVMNATCPFVKKIHRIVEKQNREGHRVIIIGDENHPKVRGIKGQGDDRTLVVKMEEQLNELPVSKDDKLYIVSQTTFNYNKFQDLVERLSKRDYDIPILNTICNTIQERQVEAGRIASQVDAVIVINGKNSSNTQKLYETCHKECKNTYYVQTLGDLNPESVSSVHSIGITTGALTPNYITEEVHTNARIKF